MFEGPWRKHIWPVLMQAKIRCSKIKMLQVCWCWQFYLEFTVIFPLLYLFHWKNCRSNVFFLFSKYALSQKIGGTSKILPRLTSISSKLVQTCDCVIWIKQCVINNHWKFILIYYREFLIIWILQYY